MEFREVREFKEFREVREVREFSEFREQEGLCVKALSLTYLNSLNSLFFSCSLCHISMACA